MNEGTREQPPVSQRGRYEPLPVPLRQVLEPNVGMSFGEPDTIPNYHQKFIPNRTPMEDLTRNFLSQSIDKMSTDQDRVDRNKVIELLQGLGLFESEDSKKPLSTLIQKVNQELPPERQLPIVNETLANIQKNRQNQPVFQNQRDAQAIQGMRQHNQNQQNIYRQPPTRNQPQNLRPSEQQTPGSRIITRDGRVTPIQSLTRNERQQFGELASPPTQPAFTGAGEGSAGNIVPDSNQTQPINIETKIAQLTKAVNETPREQAFQILKRAADDFQLPSSVYTTEGGRNRTPGSALKEIINKLRSEKQQQSVEDKV